jgi:hypothetical protein
MSDLLFSPLWSLDDEVASKLKDRLPPPPLPGVAAPALSFSRRSSLSDGGSFLWLSDKGKGKDDDDVDDV